MVSHKNFKMKKNIIPKKFKIFLNHHNAGFTLIDVLLSLVIFVTFITIVTASFTGLLKTQKQTTAFIEMNDTLSTVLTRLVSEIQFGDTFNIDPSQCDSLISFTSGLTDGCKIQFINQFGELTAYGLKPFPITPSDNGTIIQRVDKPDPPSTEENNLTPNTINVTYLHFEFRSSPADSVPLITIHISAQSVRYPNLMINLQASATPRFSKVL